MSTTQDMTYEGRALVAAFGDPQAARDAADRLHEDGFRDTWLGITGGGNAPGADESFGAKVGRFFGGGRSLFDELVRHGVGENEARRLDATLPPDSAILTVDGLNHPELAAEVVESFGGHIVAGEAFGTTAFTGEPGTARGSQILGYGDAARYARGEPIDEQRRIRLREERLTIDTPSRIAGEARITKDVVEHRQDVDVPVVHEELFIERRPIADDAADEDVAPIGEGETIRIPLMREDVVVTKRPVVTGEVVIGKRRITELQRVGGTTREERVTVDGPADAIEAQGYDEDV